MLNTISFQPPTAPVAPRAPMVRTQDGQGGPSVLPAAPNGVLMGRVALLTDANELHPALLEAVNEARTSVKVDFELLRGKSGLELSRQLARRARQGLRVQVLAWGRPTPGLREAVKAARGLGLQVRLLATETAGQTGKFLLVDDRMALLGALTPPRTTLARRALLRLTGEAAGELGRQFNHDWAQAGGTPSPLPERHVSRTTSHELLSSIQIAGNGAQRKRPRAVVLSALQRAHSTIDVMAESLEDGETIAALAAARRRGVKVRVLLSGHAEQTRAIARLSAAGIPVRRYSNGGSLQSLEMQMALVDGETMLFGSAAWTRAGLDGAGELLVEARGGRELSLARATFLHDWTHGVVAERPRLGARVAAEVAPALTAVSRLLARYSPAEAARSMLGLHVGVQKLPGGKVKLLTEVR
ncbi:MAG TPA: phosphatidylserine/phosphatidylglycerophosphate/cardiolipin synthase family protein [Oscillatoriaceae cyanobacterium]